mmetsp:Transcript_95235/g.308399  ORF Transcript_95235/g.308399 Transcript_95235/m.308399 type:complete len:345 (-) Transcript_95235:11-1045(-)
MDRLLVDPAVQNRSGVRGGQECEQADQRVQRLQRRWEGGQHAHSLVAEDEEKHACVHETSALQVSVWAQTQDLKQVLGRLRQQRGLHSAGSIAGPDEQGRRRQRHRHMRLPTEDDLAGDVQELGQAQDHVQGTRDGVDMACIRHRPHVAQRPGFEHLVPLLLPLCHFRIVHLRLRCDRLAIHQGRAEPLPMESGLRLAHRETITPSLQLVEGVQFPVRRVQALLLLPGRPTCDTSICAAADHSQHGPRPAPARSSAPGAAERGGGCGQRAARGCCDEGALRALLRQGAATASCDGSWSERSQHAAWSARHACACAQSWNHHRRCTCRVVCLAANGLNHRAERNS